MVAGAAVGGILGSAAFGVGAVPGLAAGAIAGSQVGVWILGLMGLKELATGLMDMFPVAVDHYERGFREAWGTMPANGRISPGLPAIASGDVHAAAWHMGQGHVTLIMAILTALVAYLTRGKGSRALLLQQIRESQRLGAKFADWLVANEGKLVGHPQLQVRPNNPVANTTAPKLAAYSPAKQTSPERSSMSGNGKVRPSDYAKFAASANSTSAAFDGVLYPPEKLRQLVPYLEKRGVYVYGTNGNPRFDGNWNGTGAMYLPANPTALQVKHELSHYLDFKAKIREADDVRSGVQAFVDMGRLGREEAVLNRLQNNRIWQELNDAEKDFSIGYVEKLRRELGQ